MQIKNDQLEQTNKRLEMRIRRLERPATKISFTEYSGSFSDDEIKKLENVDVKKCKDYAFVQLAIGSIFNTEDIGSMNVTSMDKYVLISTMCKKRVTFDEAGENTQRTSDVYISQLIARHLYNNRHPKRNAKQNDCVYEDGNQN